MWDRDKKMWDRDKKTMCVGQRQKKQCVCGCNLSSINAIASKFFIMDVISESTHLLVGPFLSY